MSFLDHAMIELVMLMLHSRWYRRASGQVGRAWPRAQAVTVTRSDTPSPPALTAPPGR